MSDLQALLGAFRASYHGSQQPAVDVKQLVAQADAAALCAELQQLLQSQQAKDALSQLLRATRPALQDPPLAAAACVALRGAIASRLPGWLHELPADQGPRVKELVLVAMAELEHLAPADRMRLSSCCLAGLEEGRPHAVAVLELLPPCLLLIPPGAADGASQGGDGRCVADAVDGGDSHQGTPSAEPSAAHRDSALHRLLHAEWRPAQVSALLAVAREIPLSPAQAKEVIRKAISCARAAELQQLPPILYQVLLASAAGPRIYALGKVAELFEQLARARGGGATGGGQDRQAAPGSVLLQVEGTVLMHISTLVKYDAALGSEWLKHFKAGGLRPSPFLLQVALTMCGVARLEAPVLQLLKRAALVAYAAEQPGAGCAWLAASGTMTGVEDGRGGGVALEEALLRAVRHSQFAGELVAPGALALGRQLLACQVDSPLHLVLACGAGEGADASGSKNTGMGVGAGLPAQASPGTRAVRLGLLLLGAVFENHPEARDEVLRSCQLGATKLEACLPRVLLLARLCRAQPGLLAGHMQPLKDCLGQFAALPPAAAMALLRALWPLCRVRRELQDHVIMLLRKVMYGRDLNSRVVAIRGFMYLILEQLRAAPEPSPATTYGSQASGSQASLSQMSALSSGGGVNLLQELAGVLRRALTQQAPVRAALYSGLSQVLSADPRCHELLSELLYPHMQRYVSEGDALPPLDLGKCTASHQLGVEPALVEPLPALLACARRLAALQTPDDGSQGGCGTDGSDATTMSVGMASQLMRVELGCECSKALQALLCGLRKRLLQCEPEHFGLDRGAELNPATPAGALNQMHIGNLLGAVEVVMEDIVAECQLLNLAIARGPDAPPHGAAHSAQRHGRDLAEAYRLHSRLVELARAGARGGAGKGRKGPGTGSTGTSGAADATAKRSKPASQDYVPVEARAPQLSAPCVAALCGAIVEDGLVQPPPAGWGASAGPSAPSAGGGDAETTRLLRSDKFRAFVLSAAANMLEATQRDAAGAVLLDGGGGAGGGAWLVLGGPLFKLVQSILGAAAPGGRHVGGVGAGATMKGSKNKSGKGSKGAGGAAATSSAASGGAGADSADGGGGDTLEWLAARALLQAVFLADATQQLVPFAHALAPPPQQQQQQQQLEEQDGVAIPGSQAHVARGSVSGLEPKQAGDVALVAALARLLPLVQRGVDSLMQASCFKAAHAVVQALALLGRRLAAAEAAAQAAATAAAGAAAKPRAGQQQQQQQQCGDGAGAEAAAAKALAAQARQALQSLSAWARQACQQRAPEVTNVPLIKSLLELVVRCSRSQDDLVVLKQVADDVQRVVGHADSETQATQTQGSSFPVLTAERTGQPSATFVMAYIDEALADVDRAIAGIARGADGDGGAAAGAQAQLRMRAGLCRRLDGLSGILGVAVNTVLGMNQIVEAMVRSLTRIYKTLLAAAKLHTPARLERGAAGAGGAGSGRGGGVATAAAAATVTADFQRLVSAVNRELTPPMYQFLSDTKTEPAQDSKPSTVNRAKRDARAVPNLVFAVEAWERQLVLAGRAAKVNLMRDAKRSTNRDFKLLFTEAGGDASRSKGAKRKADTQLLVPKPPTGRTPPAGLQQQQGYGGNGEENLAGGEFGDEVEGEEAETADEGEGGEEGYDEEGGEEEEEEEEGPDAGSGRDAMDQDQG